MFLKGQKNKLKWFVNWISWLLLLQGFHQKSRLWPQAYQCPLMCGSRVPRSSSRHSGSMQGRWLHSTARLDSGLTATLDSGHHGIPHVQNSKDKLTHLSALDWPRLVLRALCHSAAQPWHLQPVTTRPSGHPSAPCSVLVHTDPAWADPTLQVTLAPRLRS